MSGVYKTLLFISLIMASLLVAIGSIINYNNSPVIWFAGMLFCTITGILVSLKIQLKVMTLFLGLFHLVLVYFLSAQTLQVKELKVPVFIMEMHSLEIFFTGIGIWILAGIAALNRFSARRFIWVGSYVVLLVTGLVFFITERNSGVEYLGHDPSLLGSLKFTWLAYSFFGIYSAMRIWKNYFRHQKNM